MTATERLQIAITLVFIGVGWWFGVEIHRGRSQDHSRRMFWLHLTACPIAIVLMIAGALVLAYRLGQKRAAPPQASLVSPTRERGSTGRW